MNFVLFVACVVSIAFSPTRILAAIITASSSGGRVGRHGVSERARIHTLHIMTHAEAQAKVSDNKSAGHREADDEDADDTRSLPITDGNRRQFKGHERKRHGVAGGKEDNAAGGAGCADEVHDCQQHQAGHQQR